MHCVLDAMFERQVSVLLKGLFCIILALKLRW